MVEVEEENPSTDNASLHKNGYEGSGQAQKNVSKSPLKDSKNIESKDSTKATQKVSKLIQSKMKGKRFTTIGYPDYF